MKGKTVGGAARPSGPAGSGTSSTSKPSASPQQRLPQTNEGTGAKNQKGHGC